MSEAQYDASSDIDAEVQKQLASLNDSIKNTVVRMKVNAELERRQTMLRWAVREVEQNTGELEHMKPQLEGFNEAGVLQSGLFFTTEQKAYRERLVEKVNRLKEAINAAVTEANWTLLSKLPYHS